MNSEKHLILQFAFGAGRTAAPKLIAPSSLLPRAKWIAVGRRFLFGEVVTMRGIKDLYVLVFLCLHSREVIVTLRFRKPRTIPEK